MPSNGMCANNKRCAEQFRLFDFKGNIFKRQEFSVILFGCFSSQSLKTWIYCLLKPVLRLFVDLIALAEVAYADGDVAAFRLMSGYWRAGSCGVAHFSRFFFIVYLNFKTLKFISMGQIRAKPKPDTLGQ